MTQKQFSFSLLFVCLAVSSQAIAQVSKWDYDLSEVQAARFLGFSQPGKAEAAHYYSNLGVGFSGAGRSRPVKSTVTFPTGEPVPLILAIIRNDPIAETSAGKPLVIDFADPVSRVGLRAAQDPAADVELLAYAADGALLGSVVYPPETWSVPGWFRGIRTTHPAGISKLVVSYGQAAEPEQVETLWWLPLLAPEYVTSVGQVAAGRFGDYSLETEIQIQEVKNGPRDLSGEVRFYDQLGEPIPFKIDGKEQSAVSVHLAALRSLRLRLENTGQPGRVGYAILRFEYPVAVNAIYRTSSSSGALLHEAGIAGTPGRYGHFVPVERNISSGLDTGIAIINTGSTAQNVSLLLRGAGPNVGKVYQLQPGEQRALFLSEMFSSLGDSFEGSLSIGAGSGTTAVVALRTINGLAASSLPAGSLEP